MRYTYHIYTKVTYMAGETTSKTMLKMYGVEFNLSPWSTFAASHIFAVNELSKKGYKWADNSTMLQGDHVEITFISHEGKPKLKYNIDKSKIAILDLFGVIQRLNMSPKHANLYLQYHPELKYLLSISSSSPNTLVLSMRLQTGEITQFQFECDENGLCKVTPNDVRYSYLQHAIAEGITCLRVAIADHDPTAMDDQNAFHSAAIEGNYSKVKELIENGFDPHRAYFTRDVVKSFSNQLIKNILTLNNNGEKNLKLKARLKHQYELYLNYRNILKLLPKSHSQKWMISRLQTLYPSAEPKGICFAVAIMSTQALLANDMDTFNNRLAAMSRVPLKKFAAKVKDIQQKRVAIYREAKAQCEVMIANGEIPDINKIADDMMRQCFSDDDYYLRDIAAFLDGIKAYQQSEKYREVFPERRAYPIVRALEMMKLLSPISIANIDNFSGVYKLSELTKHLIDLKAHLAAHGANYPVALRLSANNHAIMVGYDNRRMLWYLIDANQFPVTKMYRSETLLSQKILHALFAKDIEVISTSIFVAADHEAYAIAAITQWKTTDVWQKTHAVTAERAKMKGDGGNRWMDIMHNDGNPETVSQLNALSKRKYIIPMMATTFTLSVAAMVAAVAIIVVFFTPVGYVIAGVVSLALLAATLAMAVRFRDDINVVKPIPELPRIEKQGLNAEKKQAINAVSPSGKVSPQVGAVLQSVEKSQSRLFQPIAKNIADPSQTPVFRHRK